ncbi:MAG: ribonuclease HIII [Bacilli bacterium]|nr:ribonuclease HIII [Bacilli bacterium]
MNVVIRVNEDTKKQMLEYYKDKMRDKKIPYVVFQAEDEDTVITMYESGKVMFQGKSADVDAAHWGIEIEEAKKDKDKEKDKKKYEKYYYSNSIGSDEVGTGDYFGPIVVTATYVTKEDIPYLESLGVMDSKKITDEKIKDIAPKIANKVKYKSIILRNVEYNEKYDRNTNLNKIKSIMHNKVLYDLVKEIKKYDYIIVDQFAYEESYYNYLKDVDKVQRDITFITKAEDKNLAVACGSIISRYLFLREFDKLSDSIHIPLPKGAGADVDKVGEEIVDKFGEEKLKEIAKVNFKNTDRILHTMIY